jgi:uncharacterized protein
MASSTIVIANTTPLINFAEIGRLDLLRELFDEVTVPTAVIAELHAKADRFPLAAAATSVIFLRVHSAVSRERVQEFQSELHAGEAECLALALEQPGSWLLLDDVAARTIASRHGLRVLGTIGCLRLAKDRGLISAIAPLLDQLQTSARFWISSTLRTRVLTDAGELIEGI